MSHKIVVSGIVNVETNVYADHFPIEYAPIRYLNKQISSNVGGVAFNIASALSTLSSDSLHWHSTIVELSTVIGKDTDATTILGVCENKPFKLNAFSFNHLSTPHSVILYSNDGNRMIFNDLKNIQQEPPKLAIPFYDVSLFVACNVNFNRHLLQRAKYLNTKIATDVHVLSNPYDEYNREFLEAADILFLSDEGIQGSRIEFLSTLKTIYPSEIIVLGCGKDGAILYIRAVDTFYYFGPVKNDNVVNTVGAGDALFSSFLHYYVNGYNPILALTRAEVFASRKISFNGSSNGFSTERQIEEELSKISIQIEKI